MDQIPQDYLVQAYGLYNRYSAYIAPIRAAFLHFESLFFRFIYPTFYPLWRLSNYAIRKLLLNINNSSATSPSTDALVSFIALALIFMISLQAVNFVRRQIMWWISMVTTLVTWVVVGFSAWYIYNRGVEASVEDAAYLAGLVLGWTKEGNAEAGRLASEREWDAERMRRQGGGRYPGKRSRGGGW